MKDNETCSKYVGYQFHDAFMDESLFRTNVKMNIQQCDSNNIDSNIVSLCTLK